MSSTNADVNVSQIHGVCDARFSAVQRAFEQNFAEHGEVGAALAIYVDGHLVVDLWGGFASRAEHLPWRRDTLVNVYSTTKGLSALCVNRLIDQGAIDPDAPVARYWPEFAAQGKGEILVRQLLGHRAGLAALSERLPHEALYDQARMAAALAAQAPNWPPGERHGYHAQTFGFLLAELVRRVTSRTLGRYFHEEIAAPLSADVHIGLAAEHDARVAKVTRPLGLAAPAGELDLVSVFQREPESLTARAFTNPAPSPGAINTRAYRAAEIPSSNAHATAEGLACIYANLANAGAASPGHASSSRPPSPQLLSAAGVARCYEEQSYGPDAVLRLTTRFGMGFMRTQTGGSARGPGWFSPNDTAFGHPGLGGSIAFADPAANVAFGYVMNRAGMNILVGERPRRLIEALYEALGV